MKQAYVAMLVCFALPSIGLSQTAPIFKERDMSEGALIEALTPPVKVRSIRVAPNEPAAKPPSANLLITFHTNSSELTAEARQSLDVVAKALNSDRLSTFRFVVEGHADPRGTSDLNQRLSQERARAVRQYLVERHAIAEGRLKVVGKGDKAPLNTDNPAAPENRRVTIVTQVE